MQDGGGFTWKKAVNREAEGSRERPGSLPATVWLRGSAGPPEPHWKADRHLSPECVSPLKFLADHSVTRNQVPVRVTCLLSKSHDPSHCHELPSGSLSGCFRKSGLM